jgi:hypothetical protein
VKGGVCITHGETRKRCSHERCTKQAQKGGVCTRHRSKSTIISTNNPTLEANNALPSSVPPSHQSTDYEDEENLIHGFGNLVKFQGSLVDTMCSYK